jgi:hypothetical protein
MLPVDCLTLKSALKSSAQVGHVDWIGENVTATPFLDRYMVHYDDTSLPAFALNCSWDHLVLRCPVPVNATGSLWRFFLILYSNDMALTITSTEHVGFVHAVSAMPLNVPPYPTTLTFPMPSFQPLSLRRFVVDPNTGRSSVPIGFSPQLDPTALDIPHLIDGHIDLPPSKQDSEPLFFYTNWIGSSSILSVLLGYVLRSLNLAAVSEHRVSEWFSGPLIYSPFDG